MYRKWEKVGQIGVDAGICWIGDPCYILHKEEDKKPIEIGKNWSDFCNILEINGIDKNDKVQFGSNLGVVVSTGYGDGIYDVYVTRTDGRIKEVRVVFIEENDDYE